MELNKLKIKDQIKISGIYLPSILKLIEKVEVPFKHYEFLYGQEEYTSDYSKIKKQIKRLWRKKK